MIQMISKFHTINYRTEYEEYSDTESDRKYLKSNNTNINWKELEDKYTNSLMSNYLNI